MTSCCFPNASDYPKLAFSKTFRLLKSYQFQSLAKHAHTFHGKVLFIVWRKNLHGVARLGITVNRKQGSSVVRNRFKRLVREAFRLQKNRLHLGIDIHVRPSGRSRGKNEFPPSFDEVTEDITSFFQLMNR
jgi:ribonuclease P protein component